MNTKLLSTLATVGLAALLAVPAGAQTDHMHFGPRLNYDATNSTAGLGVQFSGPISHHLEFYPSFDYYFVDVGSRWSGNFDLKYRFSAERPVWWYLGTGLAVDHSSVGAFSNTEAGWNLFLGVEPLRGPIHPFAEVRATESNGSRVGFLVGLNFTLGKAHQ